MLFGIVIPTSFYIFEEIFFVLVLRIFLGHLPSPETDNSTQPLPMENLGEFESSSGLWRNNHRSRLPDDENSGEYLRSGDLLASFPGGKPEIKETS